MKKLAAIFMILFLVGCVQEKQEQVFIERIALLSVPEIHCGIDNEYAYLQFVYQENGVLNYINTKTDCKSLVDYIEDQRMVMGEQISVLTVNGRAIRVRRENGATFEVEHSTKATIFFGKEINPIDVGYNIPITNRINVVIEECNLLKSELEHDVCLSQAAAIKRDPGLCDSVRSENRKVLCRQWIGNLNNF